MLTLRHFFLTHRALALVIIALALAMKALVPTGMMVEARGDLTLTMTICSGMGALETVTIPIEREQSPQDQHQSSSDKQVCGFSVLGHGALGGADAVQLAAGLLFIILIGFAPIAQVRVTSPAYRWPHTRGPPLGV